MFTKEWLGDVCILTVGDCYQFPPVGQLPVYMWGSDMNSLDILAPLPWEDFKLHELTEVMRQTDKAFAKFLNSVCVKTPEKDSEDVILQSCEVKVNCNHDDYPKNAKHIYARNVHCSDWNDHMLNSSNGDMYVCVSIDSRKDHHTNLVNVPFPT